MLERNNTAYVVSAHLKVMLAVDHTAALMAGQMFYAMILAAWYKSALKDALLNQVYSDKAKTSGVLAEDVQVKEKIYQQYLAAYKKGVFNYIQDDALLEDITPRKYFSGGLQMKTALVTEHAPERLNTAEKISFFGAGRWLLVGIEER